jgi:hypothetical protein
MSQLPECLEYKLHCLLPSQQSRHKFWYNLSARSVDPLDEEAGALRGFEIEFDCVGAGAACLFDKARCRLDTAGSADREVPIDRNTLHGVST